MKRWPPPKKQQGQILMGQCKFHLRARPLSKLFTWHLISVLVPAYEHPTLWEGHASMIAEASRQLPGGTKPDAIFCSVGGGGLLGGVMSGCKSVGWDDG